MLYLRNVLIPKGGKTYIIHDAMMVLFNGSEVGAECLSCFTVFEMWFKVWGICYGCGIGLVACLLSRSH